MADSSARPGWLVSACYTPAAYAFPHHRMAGTFISYRREDAAGYAGRLRESLERRLGNERVFRDVDTLRPGDDFVRAIDSRLAECRVMLVVIGREWLDARTADGARRLDDAGDFVRLEVVAALARPTVLVVPVLVEGMTMPPSAALPGPLRPLARRHAVSVRDETWNADIDRLVDLIDDAEGAWQSPYERVFQRRRLQIGLAAAAVLLLAAIAAIRFWPAAGSQAPDPKGPRTLTAGAPEPDRTASPDATPYTIAIPRLAEAGFDNVVYSVVSGNVVSRADGRELRLRIRVMNGGPYPVNFWDDSFRLTGGGRILAPSSGLNETVPGYSLRYGIIAFRFDTPPASAVLQVRQRTATAEVPLDLTATGRPPVDEQAAIADSLSQAVAWRPVLATGELIGGPGLAVTVERAVVRRFVNTARLTISLRFAHSGSRARSASDLSLRVVVGDDVMRPWQEPQDTLAPDSTQMLDFVFDLPVTADDVQLRATIGDRSVQRQLSLSPPS